MKKENKIIVFDDKKIRRIWHEGEWHYVVRDIVGVLVDSKDIRQYINKMRQRDDSLNEGWVQIVHPLLIETSGGKQMLNCANKEVVRLK